MLWRHFGVILILMLLAYSLQCVNLSALFAFLVELSRIIVSLFKQAILLIKLDLDVDNTDFHRLLLF